MQVLERESQQRGQTVEALVQGWIEELAEEADVVGFRPAAGDVVNETFASNPGHVRVQWGRFFRAYPNIPLGFGIVFGVLGWLIAFKSVWWALLLLIAVPLLGLLLGRIKTQFQSGDTNPGVIVSQQPPLVAAMTDLTQGGGAYPIVKILRQPLRACGLAGAAPGTRVAMCSLYSMAQGEAPHWSDFDPVILQAATARAEAHQARFDSIPASEWEQLESALAALTSREVGLHPVGWQPKTGALLGYAPPQS